ncbi:flagellar motor protein MotB [Planctomicrobium sp. SH668]|uniref:flagellar motor protein MotB n=1 Tax=Planctomicrobium sp. SH668 TaxID=3448126 RepID=UPI003F5BDF82
MAGKGGGAWKVAYADFVTAMMAFFLVMWLVSQDQKVKESIAHYFQGPIGVNVLGETARHKTSGGLFYSEVHGSVPGQTHRTAGRSIGMLKEPYKGEEPTIVVAEWLLEEPSRYQVWAAEASEQIAEAKKLPAVQDGTQEIGVAARRLLGHKMKQEMLKIANQSVNEPVLLDMMQTLLNQVDWESIAEETIERSKGP